MYIDDEYCSMGPRGRFYSYVYLVNVDWDRLFLGRAPCTKETLPDFHEWCRVTRHPLVFRGLKGSQRTPGFWGVTHHVHSIHLISNPSTLDLAHHLICLGSTHLLRSNKLFLRPISLKPTTTALASITKQQLFCVKL